jgi:hypothetical protein
VLQKVIQGEFLFMDTDTRWVSIDPGTHIGMAYWSGSERVRTTCRHVGKMWKDVLEGSHAAADEALEWDPRVVVCEDFLLRGRVGSTDREGLSPVQTTFAMLAYMDAAGWVGDVVMQLPSEAISVITDERLDRYGLLTGNAHEKDATRHGVLYLRKMGIRVPRA